MSRVLHATDFSPASQPAFRLAVDWAQRRRAELVLLHVVPFPAIPVEGAVMTARLWQQLEDGGRRQAAAGLERLAARARRRGVKTSVRVAQGVAFEEIVRVARRLRATLIVLGTHGRTGVRRLVLGSVAERVVARASCPVLTVRGA